MYEPKLILINGNPGMGKTTIAQRYANDHPMALNLDIDNIWIMMGQWQASRPQSEVQKLKYAYVIAEMHLAEGYDVIVPNLMETTEQYVAFARIARRTSARLYEIALLSDLQDAIERCKARARKLGYPDGFRPGGVLDSAGRELRLSSMYRNMLTAIATRKHIYRIMSQEGDIDGAYQSLLNIVSETKTRS